MKQMIFVPTEDITLKELADIVSGLMIIVPKEVTDKLSPEIQKHFKEIPDKPRIVVPK